MHDLEYKVIEHYEACRFRAALEGALDIARVGNRYISTKQPWKTDDFEALTYTLLCAQRAIRLLAPIIPVFAEKALAAIGPVDECPADGYQAGNPEPIFRRIEDIHLASWNQK